MDLLNLDDLAPIRRNVILFGVRYPVKEMTVEHFVEINQLANELEQKKDMTPVESVNATVRSVALSLEGCDVETLKKLSIEQLSVLSRFIRGEFEKPAAPGATTAEGEDQGNVEAQPTKS